MAIISPDDKRLVFLPEGEIDTARGMAYVYRNMWFAVCPERGLIFWQSVTRRRGLRRGATAQMHRDESMARKLYGRIYPWAEVRCFERVIVEVDLTDLV